VEGLEALSSLNRHLEVSELQNTSTEDLDSSEDDHDSSDEFVPSSEPDHDSRPARSRKKKQQGLHKFPGLEMPSISSETGIPQSTVDGKSQTFAQGVQPSDNEQKIFAQVMRTIEYLGSRDEDIRKIFELLMLPLSTERIEVGSSVSGDEEGSKGSRSTHYTAS
jgi:hypothetical protein